MQPEPLIHYRDYIKSEHWEARKQAYFETHEKKCAVCGHPDVELYHIKYGNYGREKDSDLAPLCRFHHQELHFTVGVRKDTKHESVHVIQELRQRWSEQFRDLPIVPMPVKQITVKPLPASTPQIVYVRPSYERVLEQLAAPIWRLLARVGVHF